MAVPADLLQQLLALGEADRVKLAHTLMDRDDGGRFEIAQELLGSVDDGMSDSERARLHAALDQSLAELDAGKGIPFEEAMAWLRARRQRRAAM